MLCEAFTQVLKSGRADFNMQFAQMKREHPTLDDAAFSDFVRTCMNPLVAAVHKQAPDAVFGVVCAAWETGLELVAQRLAGPQARHPWINRMWQEVLVQAAAHLERSPRQILSSLSNAAHHLGTTPGTRPEQWLGLMQQAVALAPDIDTLLKAGQVAAWRCGLAHYRDGALAQALDLPGPLALTVLAATESAWPELHTRLSADPWHVPGAASRQVGEVMWVGEFRGFGGLFTTPPQVTVAHDQIWVRSGDDVWLLTADAFGATFHRATQEEFSQGTIQKTAEVAVPEGIGTLTSSARTSTTLAVTGSLTHAVILFSLP